MRRNLGIVVLALVVFFIARVIFNDFGNVLRALENIRIEYLLAAVVFNCLFFYFRAFSWGFIIEALGKKISRPEVARIWFLSEATRYIPGKVWSFIARVAMLKERGISVKIGTASVIIEVLLILSITTILSFSAFFEYVKKIDSFSVVIGGVIVSAAALILVVTPQFRTKIIENLKKLKEVKINFSILIISALLQVLAWTCYGLGVYFLAKSIAPESNPATLIFMAIFSWLIGYISFIAPTGIGIREGMLVVLLSQFMSSGQAAIIALLGRFVITLTEIGNVGMWLLIKERSQLRAIPKFILKHWSYFILGLFVVLYIVTFSTLSILRHNAFASNFDLANMSQTVWNTINGRPFELSGALGTISRFEIHADLILALLSPFYLIWDKARMLLILQSVFLGLGAIPVYFLAQKVLNKKIISLIVAAAYLLNPSMQWTNIYDFHGVSLAIPFLLAAFYFAYSASRETSVKANSILTQKWNWYWLFIILAITTKEQISLFIAMLGVVIFLVFKARKVGILTFVLGVTWFLSMVFVIMPFFSPHGEHWALNWFKAGGEESSGLSAIPSIESIITKFFYAPDIKEYYISLLKPFGYLPVLGLPWLILSLPELAINVISSHAQMRATVFHYDSGITPSLVIATIFGLGYIDKIARKIKPLARFANWAVYLAAVWLILVALRVNYHYSPLPTTPSCWCWIYQVSEEDRRFDELLLTIPEDAIVTSSGEIRAHLTQREHSYNLPNATESADYIAILNQTRIVGDYRPKEFETRLIEVLNKSPEHELLDHFGYFYLYKRKDYQP